MLVLNFFFVLPNFMVLSIFMLGFNIGAISYSELKGLHKNVQNFYSRCFGSQEIAKKQSGNSIGGHPVYVMVSNRLLW